MHSLSKRGAGESNLVHIIYLLTLRLKIHLLLRDHHSEVDSNISSRFARVNFAIEKFVKEVKALNLWNNVTVVQFSEFARTLDPNSGNGVDHAWGGNHFHFGGAVNGGKVRGLYPHDFVESSLNPIALSRGRMIPEHPWDAMWYGTAEWFGINVEGDEIDKVLPMNKNFPSEKLYGEAELYKAVLPAASAQILDEGPIVAEMAYGEPAIETGNDITELDLTIDNEGELATKLLGLGVPNKPNAGTPVENSDADSPVKFVDDYAVDDSGAATSECAACYPCPGRRMRTARRLLFGTEVAYGCEACCDKEVPILLGVSK